MCVGQELHRSWRRYGTDKGGNMIRAIVLFVMAMAASQATAEVFMCKNASGGTEFSDTPCKAGSTSEVVPD
ncbi:MAG: DUF4124 domain-containing protein, partial [Bacteroidales bacterium]